MIPVRAKTLDRFDFYVNDASARPPEPRSMRTASLLQAAAGMLESEVSALSRLLVNQSGPLCVIGGAKVEDS